MQIRTQIRAALLFLFTTGFAVSLAAQSARIAFTAPVTAKTKPSQTYQQVFSMTADGTDVIQLTTANANTTTPVWSPGQAYIAFTRARTVVVMEAKGEAAGGRSFPVAATSEYGLDWSPDGSHLCYKGPYSGGETGFLYVVSVDPATGQVGVPTMIRSAEVFWPTWSPDGSRIAFCDSDDGGVTQVIKVIDVATLAEVASFGVGPAGSYNYEPKWRPDGTQIAFTGPVTTTTTTRGGKPGNTTFTQVFIANSDGSGIVQITSSSGDKFFPTWSPDASMIAFRGGGLYKMNLNTGALTLLRTSGNAPDWAP